MIDVAMIGLGAWANELAASVHNRSDSIRIRACHSPSAASRTRFSRRFDAAAKGSLEETLADPGIQAVVLATPHSTHLDLIGRAVAKGKHVFCEKPLALTYRDAQTAAALCRAAGLVLAVGQNKRFSPLAGHIKSMLDRDELGTLLHFESNFSFPGAQVFSRGGWRIAPQENPGGGLTSCAIHVFDLAAWYFGPVRSVSAIIRRRSGASDLDDVAAILLDFDCGATGYVGCLFASAYTFFVNVYGTRGAVYSEPETNLLRLHLGPLDQLAAREVTVDTVDTLKLELEAFAESCASGEPYPIAPAEAAHAVAIMEAAVLSGRDNGRRIEVARFA